MFDELGDCDCAGEADGEVDVVFHTAGEETFAVEVAGDGGEVGVEFGAEGGL